MHPIRMALEFIEACGRDLSSEAVVDSAVCCVSAFGLDHFVFTGPPLPNRPPCPPVASGGWPMEWYHRFRSRNYIASDGMAQWALRTNQPFTYAEVPDPFRRPAPARKVRAEAAAFGLVDGFVVPVGSAGCGRSAVIFNSATGCDLAPQHRAALQLIASYAVGSICERCHHAASWSRLSAREREVLAWTAEGKSAWETSVILAVSERTIAKHLEHVRTKLNAASTAQAVAEALRLGEIAL